MRDLRGIARAIAKAYMARIAPYLAELATEPAQDAKDPARVAYEEGVAKARAARILAPLSSELDVLGVQVKTAVERHVGPLFARMSGAVDKGNAKGMSLFGITPQGTGVADAIARARDENIALVENAHRAYAANVREIIGNPDNFGLRVETLKDKLLERGDVSESRAELIARDQTLKLNGEIARTRQQAAGVEKYVWSTSQDDRVREEHAALEGQVFEWSSPPEPGHPGEDFQCRCVAIPVGIEELDEAFADGT